VSDRHLRRALERELGVSPLELAQTHRLLLAKRLLADTTLSVTRIAFASGFQSLRRFNSVFRERYRLSPTGLRRLRAPRADVAPNEGLVRLTLGYRAPFAWDALIAGLAREAVPEVERCEAGCYARTVSIEGRSGVVLARDAASAAGRGGRNAKRHLEVRVSSSLLAVLMALLARIRHLFDLDAEPTVVDAHLGRSGLGHLVRRHPGLRLPGTVDGFEGALRTLLGSTLVSRVVAALGAPVTTPLPQLSRLMPDADRIAEAGVPALCVLGVPRRRAGAVVAVARAVSAGTLRLEPGQDVAATQAALADVEGIGPGRASAIVLRALHWPDAFAPSDRRLQRAAGVAGAGALRLRAEEWRPWRAYAALHLRLEQFQASSETRW
jgi:AraC family transcriptional regulator of adaptative response / DNA-3-methyladenine glycosylase II